MPCDPSLVERMRRALGGRAGVAERRMFGGYCWMLHGNMLCGAEVGRFMFRVGAEQEGAALALPGAAPMDITGRPMRGFVWVRAEHADGADLARWIDIAAAYVETLPRK
jgi:hypothetical protein